MARSRYKLKDNQHPYFMTCTIVYWFPIFSSPHIANIVIDSLKLFTTRKCKTICVGDARKNIGMGS
ncbi:hypothetical protein AVENLUH7437_01708 [Acinetobacter venetianus]|nr:hypothetical protein AVENLUH7437_01708 [Acinetobacter venetianus]